MKQTESFIILHNYPDPDVEQAWCDCLAQVETPAHYNAPEFFCEPYWEGLRPFAILAINHGNVVGVLTGIHQGRAVECGLPSRPQVCTANTADGAAAAEALASGLLAEVGSANLISVYTWRGTSLDSFRSHGFRLRALEGNVVLDLTVGPQALLKQFDENRRRNIRLAMKNKVEVEVASTSEEVRAFYEIYRAWRHTPRKEIEGEEIPFAWFEQAYRLTTNRRLLLARYEGRVIAGVTLRFFRGGLLEFSGSSALEEHLRVRPHDLLQWRAIEWGCKEGFPRYSLGGAHPFLRRFGGTVVPIDRYRLDRTWLRRHDLQEGVLDAGRETLRKMPKPVEKTVRRVFGKVQPEEIRIAASPDQTRRAEPKIPKGSHRVLDVGCGEGHTLIGSVHSSGTLAFGVDRDFGALQIGKQLAGNFHFTCALGEQLPFANNCIDYLICRVALPYMHVPTALREMGRILKPGGMIWLLLHRFTFVQGELAANIRSLNLKGILFRLYVIANGLLYHFFGWEIRYPLRRKRCESFQTRRSIERGLCAAGFEKIEVSIGERFVVTAVKRFWQEKAI